MITTRYVFLALCGIAVFFVTCARAADSDAPPIAAKAYILIDADSGHVLAEQNADNKVEPASLTKLMTGHVVFSELKAGRIKLTDTASVSEKAWRTPGSRTFLDVNSHVPIETLLLGMIVQSGNDATVTLAEHISGTEDAFAAAMTQHAQQLGMRNSSFKNSSGLPDPEHYSTARDLALLTRSIIHDFPEYYSWYSKKEFTYNNITQGNRNLLLYRDQSVDGVKTGHTESAGYCLIASAKRGDMRLISVVVGTKSESARAQESATLLNYGFRAFETHRLYEANAALAKTRIWKGESEELALGLPEALYITIPRGQYGNLKANMRLPTPIFAPATQGQTIGSVIISLSGEPYMERPLIALNAVAEGSLTQRTIDDIKLWFE